jgi:hypothetical protein
MNDTLRCLDAGQGDCSGPVEPRLLPDRDDLKAFPRCEAHFEKRLATVSRTLELTSPVRASWFNEADAGEHWGEDY